MEAVARSYAWLPENRRARRKTPVYHLSSRHGRERRLESGARVVGPEHGQRVKASDLGLDLHGLEPRLGAFTVPPEGAFSWEWRIGLAQVRLRDEKRVVWDLYEHRAVDHGYATTSYRSQGRTVANVFALASAAEARRGLYVDVTRAREDVMIAYGKDEVQDFGELLVRSQRDQGKVLVRDVERNVSVRVEQQQERERNQKQLRSVAIEQEQDLKIDRERDRSRGWGMGW